MYDGDESLFLGCVRLYHCVSNTLGYVGSLTCSISTVRLSLVGRDEGTKGPFLCICIAGRSSMVVDISPTH